MIPSMLEELKYKTHRFLRWTERYTKTDMIYLAEGGFWLFLKTVLVGAIAFLTSIAFANLLPQATYGEYKYILSIFAFLSIPTLLGMGAAATKAVAQGYGGTPLAGLMTKIRWGFLGSIAALLVALYYYYFGNTRLAEGFVIVAVFLPFIDTLGIFNSTLTGKKLFRASTFYEAAIQASTSAVVIVVLYLSDNLLYVLGCYFLSYTAARLLSFFFVQKRYAENASVDPSAITYGKHLSVMEILPTIQETIDSVLLWQFLGPAPLAVYAFARGVPLQMSAALQRINTLAFPKFAERPFGHIKQPLIGKMFKMFLLMVVIVAAYIIAAPFIFRLFFPAYMESVFYTQLYVLTLLFFPVKFIGTAFQAHAHTRALYITSSVVPVARIALALLLIPLFGILGAIIAEIASRTLNLILVSILYARAQL